MKKTNKKLLLHSCCAPCSTTVIERLKNQYLITILFYNPNIEPEAEYLKRKEEQINLLKKLKIDYLDIDYLNEEFKNIIKGYENEAEKGRRCYYCFNLRLGKTAEIAKEKSFDLFGTTLSVSPHKNIEVINEIGEILEKSYNIEYLNIDFKTQNGYQRSLELSIEYKLYRQNYCGCQYSKGE